MYMVFRMDTRQFFHGLGENGEELWDTSRAWVFAGRESTEAAMALSEHCRLVVISE